MTTFKLTEKYHKLAIRIEEDRKRMEHTVQVFKNLDILLGGKDESDGSDHDRRVSKGDRA